MGTKIGDLANSYHTAFNNRLNAQKSYIDAYITGINARNAVNQEARTKDQYWNYTNPLQKSNLDLTLAQQSLLTEMANDQTNRQYQKTITASDLGYRAGMGEQNMLNLPTDRNTSSNVALTNNTNSVFNKNASAFSLSTQDDLQKLEKDRIEQLKKAYPLMNEAQLLSLDAQINSLKTPPTGTTTDGTTNTDIPTTIMLQKGGTTPTGMFGTDGRLNFTGTTTTPASGLTSVNNRDWSLGKAEDARWNAAAASQGKTLPQPTGQQTGQVNLNSNPYYKNYSADQLQSALGNLTSSTDSILGSTPDILLSPERRARKIAFNQNYELMIQARDAKIAEQKAQQQIENQAYLKRLTDKALERQRTNAGLK